MKGKTVIRELSDIDELTALDELFRTVWGGESPLSPNTLKALAHSGNYIAGAFAAGRLIGGLVGWLGGPPATDLHLHSHILGVLPESSAQGLGFELKQHQRLWCVERGITAIEWTTDPLVRRNAYFNLTKLGARAPRYLVNVYGVMKDGINAGEESDRLLIRWELQSRDAQDAAEGRPGGLDEEQALREGTVLLEVGDDEEPVRRQASGLILLCQVPEDVVTIRRRDPSVARAWRLALRDTMRGALDSGYAIKGFTRSGWYVLESP